MTKLREELHTLQAENACVTLRNKTIEREMEELRSVNEKLQREMNDRVSSKERAVDVAQAPDASSVAGARDQTDPDGDIFMYAEPRDDNIQGSVTQPRSDIYVSKSEGLPVDVRNRLEGHVNNGECRS